MGFSDGGLRRSAGKAAVGWISIASNDKGVWRLGEGGSMVECGAAGSFAVEAWALECLADKLLTITHVDEAPEDDVWMSTPIFVSLEADYNASGTGNRAYAFAL